MTDPQPSEGTTPPRPHKRIARAGRSTAVGFARGLTYPFRGVAMVLGHKRVFLLSLVPFFVGLLVYAAAFCLLVIYADNLADLILAPGAWWRTVLRVLMMIGMWGVFLILFVFTYSLLALTIAAPFYEFLSAAAERVHTGELVEEEAGWKAMAVDVGRGITEGIKFLVIEIVLLLFGLVVPPASTVTAFALSAVVIGLEHMEGPMGRRRMTFAQKRQFARAHFWTLLGFGSVMTLALMLPLVGFVFLPFGVAGGTMLFCDITSRKDAKDAKKD